MFLKKRENIKKTFQRHLKIHMLRGSKKILFRSKKISFVTQKKFFKGFNTEFWEALTLFCMKKKCKITSYNNKKTPNMSHSSKSNVFTDIVYKTRNKKGLIF